MAASIYGGRVEILGIQAGLWGPIYFTIKDAPFLSDSVAAIFITRFMESFTVLDALKLFRGEGADSPGLFMHIDFYLEDAEC